jgi:hypothetical protein
MTNKEVIKNLKSKNNSVVSDTLNYISKEGNKDILGEVIKLLMTTKETIIRDQIIKILENLREPDCTAILVDAIENPDYQDILSLLVSASWKNSLDFSKHVETFIDVFIQSDFQLAFDAFTVIDNLEAIDYKVAEASIFRLENAIEDIKDDKKPLYFELISIIKDKKENPA